MAISATHCAIVRHLFEEGVLPQQGAILEIGEANWYDADPMSLVDDIKKYVPDRARGDALIERLNAIVEQQGRWMLFDLAKVFYEIFFSPSEVQAIDFHGTPVAQKLNLNLPITLSRRFETVINHGTAEHIFNIAQVFRTIHDYTAPGGLMIHESPLLGWIDHGFVNIQPAAFFETARANQYEIKGAFVQDFIVRKVIRIESRDDVRHLARTNAIPDNALMFVVLRKGQEERVFEIPTSAAPRR